MQIVNCKLQIANWGRGLWSIWVACLIAFFWMEGLHAQEDLKRALEAEQAELDSLKAKLEADQKRLKVTETEKRTVAEDLGRLERDNVRIRGELRNLKRREQDLAGRVGTAKQELGRVEDRLQARRQGKAQRLREMYKLGRRGRLQVLFSATSFADVLKRLRYLSRIAEQDRRDYGAIRMDRKRVGEALALQRTQYRHQRTLLQAKQETEKALGTRVADRSGRLKELQTDASAMDREIRENREAIAQSDERVRQLIQEIQEQERRGQRLAALPPFDFEAHRGRLRRPVAGRMVVRFGRHQDPELKTWTFNRGVNLAAPEGTNVRSVAPGEVVLVDWFPGYGQFVLLRHPGGFYTLYGHLASVLVDNGEIMAEGASLGTVGSTGRLDGEPQLHFEIMQGEVPLDPAEWVEKQ